MKTNTLVFDDGPTAHFFIAIYCYDAQSRRLSVWAKLPILIGAEMIRVSSGRGQG